MSQQWWKRTAARNGASAGTGGRRRAPPDARAACARPCRPGAARLRRQRRAGRRGRRGAAAARAARRRRCASTAALEEAAIRFAHGDDAGAEAILLQALAPTTARPADHDDTWRALLDLYRATGDAEKFERRRPCAMRSACSAWRPAGFAARAGARAAQRRSRSRWPTRAGDGTCRRRLAQPARLDARRPAELTRALSAAGAVWTLDWRALTPIDADAAGPLRALFAHWADSPVQLRFIGADRLLRRARARPRR